MNQPGFSLKPPRWLFGSLAGILEVRQGVRPATSSPLDLIVDPMRYDTPTTTTPVFEVDRLTAATFLVDL